MKKTKLKECYETNLNSFFADDFFDADDFLSRRNHEEFLQTAESEDFAPKISPLETILKQVFLFFPGTFFLYILSAGFTIMFLNSSVMAPRFGIVWLMPLYLAAILMTWLGLGDLKKLKHLVIPASIVGVGVFFGAFATILMTFLNEFVMHKFIDNLAFYLFPLALIVPFLAKGWVDKKSEIPQS